LTVAQKPIKLDILNRGHPIIGKFAAIRFFALHGWEIVQR
jgi:hypothetical protein